MNDPSSRTPEGIPHRCDVCGTEFRLSPSIAGDACCPNCNSLAWPIGDNALGPQPSPIQPNAVRTKEIRIRPDTDNMDLADQTRRVVSLLRKSNDVNVSVLLRGRDPKREDTSKAVLERLVNSLVPEHASIKTPVHIATRRICCTLTPARTRDDGSPGTKTGEDGFGG